MPANLVQIDEVHQLTNVIIDVCGNLVDQRACRRTVARQNVNPNREGCEWLRHVLEWGTVRDPRRLEPGDGLDLNDDQ